MKKIIAALLMIAMFLVPVSAQTSGSKPDWIQKEFDQTIVSVSFIVNDILYAGFSPTAINTQHFAPITSQLPPVVKLKKDDNGAYYSDRFFLYAIASTKRPIDLVLDFADLTDVVIDSNRGLGGYDYRSEKPNEPAGWMYTDSKDTTVKKRIKVHLEGVKTLPYTLPVVKEYTGKVQNVIATNPMDVMLRLRVDLGEIEKGNTAGNYHTVMKLTAVIK